MHADLFRYRLLCRRVSHVGDLQTKEQLAMTADVDIPEAAPGPAGTEPSLTATVKGILDDALELIKQQLAMLKAEIRADFRKALSGLIFLACGIAPMLLGQLMLCLMLVHLLHWSTLPVGDLSDPAAIPLWGCYGIVSAAFLL